MTVAPPPHLTTDIVENALLGGRVRLRQPARGYRAGMDAALLAAAVTGKPGERFAGFYAAYFRDLDGNKLNFFHMG